MTDREIYRMEIIEVLKKVPRDPELVSEIEILDQMLDYIEITE